MRLSAILLTCALATACGKPESSNESSGSPPPAPATAAPATPAQGLVLVDDPSQVCMVNDHYMGTPQIPVPVDRKTYFGCCAMCKKKLETDPSARTATDPTSGEQVDKASAVIARDAMGKVYYFANEATFKRFR